MKHRTERGSGRHSWLVVAAMLAAGCGAPTGQSMDAAERFIDAFYSFDPGQLRAVIDPGPDAERVLYYQGWAEAAHYRVQTRRPCMATGGQIQCRITVTDDFGQALGYVATDTFTLTVDGLRVTSVTFVGDDPPIFQELFDWIGAVRPEVLAGPCKDMFDGGSTPAGCARAVADAARAFMLQR